MDDQPELEPAPDMAGIVSSSSYTDWWERERRSIRGDMRRAFERAALCTCYDRTCDYCRSHRAFPLNAGGS